MKEVERVLKKIKDKIVEHYEKKGGCSCSGDTDICCEAVGEDTECCQENA